MTENAYIIGEKILLRPPEPSDAPVVTPWFNDPDIRRNIRRTRPLTVAGEAEFLRKLADDPAHLVLLIMDRTDDVPVGLTGLHGLDTTEHTAEFGLMIGRKDRWGRGLGREATALMLRLAFDTLQLRRVKLCVHEGNDRAMRIYEGAGFRREGCLRQEIFRGGRCLDVMMYGLLAEEWRAGRNAESGK